MTATSMVSPSPPMDKKGRRAKKAPPSSRSDKRDEGNDDESTELTSPMRFFALWFGIPLFIIIVVAWIIGRS